MEGPTYQPTSPLNSHVRRTFGLTCATILVPGGANGVAAKLNSPKICVYADNEVLAFADLRIFSVLFHCSMSLSHSFRGNSGSKLVKPTFEWFLYVCMALSAKFRRCVYGGNSWYDVLFFTSTSISS